MSKHSIMMRRSSAGPSRRRFLKTTLAGALLAGAFPLEAQAAKASKSAANYRDNPRYGQRCSGCRFFVGPSSCQLVAGQISPNGWSKFFKPRG